jgi:hypothetical protein
MARKFLYLIAILVVLALVALLVLRIWSRELTEYAFVPRTAFEKIAPLPANAYDDPAMWLSRPGMGAQDPAQFLPEGVARPASLPRTAVFFIHPTSYLARDHWNGAISDLDSQRRAGIFVRGMASAFNAAGEVWVPRYRQAAFGAFLTSKPQSKAALAAAYGDVMLAFDTFVREVPQDVPIVLAGHSQGALHLIHLLQDRVRGTPLANRIIGAYVIGWPVSVEHDLPAMGLPACTAPDQAGCVMNWESFAEPADPGVMVDAYRAQPGLDGQAKGTQPVLCTNPLTGRTGGTAPAEANLGTLVPSDNLETAKLVARSVPARCGHDGLLLIGDPPQMGPFVLPGNNYHIYDIPLFWTNLRADVSRREQAWTRSHAAAR